MKIIEETKEGIPFLQADGIRDAGGAAHGFSTRLGGVSQGMWASLNLGVSRGDNPDHVRENYRRFFSAIGATGDKLAKTNQVHGGKIRVVTAADWKGDPYDRVDYEADGLMTDTPGVVLLIYSADCIPILLYDPVRRVVAALHAGWRGTAAGIAATAVQRMVDVYDCRPEDILAAVSRWFWLRNAVAVSAAPLAAAAVVRRQSMVIPAVIYAALVLGCSFRMAALQKPLRALGRAFETPRDSAP